MAFVLVRSELRAVDAVLRPGFDRVRIGAERRVVLEVFVRVVSRL
jgi:hypothetical protein